MALTQDFKNECERIIKAWHPLIQYWYEKGSSYKDLSDFIDKNSNTVLTDPFFLSFKTTRTFEEIKWMSKRINEYYIDSTPTGLYFYISGIYNAPKDNKEDVQKLMHNYHLLRARFFRFINEGGLDNVSKELDTANTAKATAETALKTWTDNFGTKSPADIKGNQEKHTDYDQIKTSLDNWTSTFLNLNSSQVKIEYDKPKEVHSLTDLKPANLPANWETELARIPTLESSQKPSDLPADWKDQLAELGKWLVAFPVDKYPRGVQDVKDGTQLLSDGKDLLQQDLNKWTIAFPKDKYPNGADDVSKTIKDLEESKKNLDTLTTYWNDNISKNYGLSAFSLDALKELPSLLQATQSTNTTWQQNGFDKLFGDKIDKDSLDKIKAELDKLNIQLTQAGNSSAQSTQYLNKLLEVYKAQITQTTQAFFLNDLRLDESSNINPIYWNTPKDEKGEIDEPRSYTEKLNELKGESEPEQVINAFKIVALICATEKAQGISDKWKDKAVAKNKQFRANKLKEFEEIKKYWDLNKNITTKAENNPLYLDVITQKNDYITKLNNIITLWQPIQ